MEYKLNKVDVEIRQRINDKTKDGVIHTKDGLLVDTEQNKKEKKKLNWNNESEENKHNSKEKIIVEAVKAIDEKEIKIDAFKNSNEEKDIKRGTFLDIRK